MKKNILIALNGDNSLDLKEIIQKKNINFLIGVDGGIQHYLNSGITNLDLIIGDFDSFSDLNSVNCEKKIKLNPMKDMTDFQAALDYIKDSKLEYHKIYVVGYKGNSRLEHFYANLAVLNEHMEFIDKNSEIFLLMPGKHTLINEEYNKTKHKYVSFFAKKLVKDLTINGLKYRFNGELSPENIIGISNEFIDKQAIVSFKSGELICFISQE